MKTMDYGVPIEYLSSTVGSKILVQDVMKKDVIFVSKYESIVQVGFILSETHISGLPVVDKEKKVIGMITQADILSIIGVRREHTFKDLLKYMLGEPLPGRRIGDLVGDIMTTPVITVEPFATVAEAVRMMEEMRIRRLPVVDDKNILIGIITRGDILKEVIKEINRDKSRVK